MTRVELRALVEAATPGPWEPATYLACALDAEGNPVANDLRPPDLALIIAARTELPALLDENERLRNALRGTLRSMEMQEKRESGEFHIGASTAKALWDESKVAAKAALEKP